MSKLFGQSAIELPLPCQRPPTGIGKKLEALSTPDVQQRDRTRKACVRQQKVDMESRPAWPRANASTRLVLAPEIEM